MPSYYTDTDTAEPDMAETKTQEPAEGKTDNETAVIPKSVLGGKEFKPGEEVVLKVEKVMEDSVLVSYAYSEPGEETEPQTEPPPAAEPAAGPANTAGGGMGSMMY